MTCSLDPEFRLAISRRIVSAKINNQIVVLRRYLRTAGADAQEELVILLSAMKHIESATTINELMGFEGSGAKAYYTGLAKIIDSDFYFEGRSKRPPLDPFNSMISLGYSVLLNAVYGAIETKGLNPYFGFLHSDREKHPTLASDLIEEWRAVIVDSTMMSLINGHEISIEHFRSVEGRPGVFIEKNGMRIILSKLEAKFAAKNKYLNYVDYPIAFRRAIEMQAGELAKALESGDPKKYEPIRIR